MYWKMRANYRNLVVLQQKRFSISRAFWIRFYWNEMEWLANIQKERG